MGQCRHRRNRLWTLTGTITAVVVALSLFGLVAWSQWQEANARVRQLQVLNLANQLTELTRDVATHYHSWMGSVSIELIAPRFTHPLQLAKDAVLTTLNADGYTTREAFDALRIAVESAPPWYRSLHLRGSNGATSTPADVAFSPAGKFLASVSNFGTVTVWDAETLEAVRSARISKEESWNDWTISWCDDESLLVSGRNDPWSDSDKGAYRVRVVSSPPLEEVATRPVSEAFCSPSGTWGVVSKDELSLFDREDKPMGETISLPKESGGFALSADSTHVAYHHDGSVKVVTPSNRETSRAASLGDVQAIRWHRRDNRLLAVSLKCTENRANVMMTTLADVNGGNLGVESQTTGSYGIGGSCKYYEPAIVVAISLDLKLVATGHGDCGMGNASGGCSDVVIRLWDATRGDLMRVMYGHKNAVTSIAWSPDSSILASGSLHSGAVGTQPDERVLLWKTEALWNVNGWWAGNELLSVGSWPDGVQVGDGESIFSERAPSVVKWSNEERIMIGLSKILGAARNEVLDAPVITYNPIGSR